MAEQQETQHNFDGNVKKIGEFVKDIEFAMLTTVDEKGKLQSRPMHTQKIEFDGDVYFFTYDDSHKSQQISRNQWVNLAYSSPAKNDYLSLSGSARISHDRRKMEELWQPQLKAWFPQELETPGIALLKVEIESAEYWDAPSSTIAHAIGLVKSSITGQPQSVGDNVTLQVEN